MKWLIKNPAPSDSRRMKWGDYHFGRSLSKYLERLGHEVETQYDPDWGEDVACDVVLVLRGKYPFSPSSHHQGAVRVMWNISHPADVSLDEYDSYDLVFVASDQWAATLGDKLSVPVFPLRQCSDLEEFTAPAGDMDRRDLIFVGNTRSVERPAVLWALEYGVPLKIWGRGWEKYSAESHVVGDYYPNQELGRLYGRARATLNDHWDDMKEYGFINNRIFDALACGLPVISDWHDALQVMLPSEVMFYRDRSEFEQCMESLMLDYPTLLERTRRGGELVRAQFSFEQRAQALSDAVEMYVSAGSTAR